MSVAINEIDKEMPQLNVVALIDCKSDTKTYGTNGVYMNIELTDRSCEKIKLTVFGEDVNKVKDLAVSALLQFFYYINFIIIAICTIVLTKM